MFIRPSRAAFTAAGSSPRTPLRAKRLPAALRPPAYRQTALTAMFRPRPILSAALPCLFLAAPSAPAGAPFLTGDQVVRLAEVVPAILLAAASLIVSLRARQSAREAQDTARDAQDRAAEAAREQINFALRRGVPPPPSPLPHAVGEGETENEKGEKKE